ncbi:energy transducer TonB, partial [Myxococcota bacterium]|nr:energy transducer TonB [Myxococcota bacterium]
AVVTPRDPSVPLELHWSEVAQLSGDPVAWPAGVAADASCKVRFVIDPAGSPTDIRPEDCAADLLPAVMKAAWTYRFSPAMEAGNAVAAQFVFIFTPGT